MLVVLFNRFLIPLVLFLVVVFCGLLTLLLLLPLCGLLLHFLLLLLLHLLLLLLPQRCSPCLLSLQLRIFADKSVFRSLLSRVHPLKHHGRIVQHLVILVIATFCLLYMLMLCGEIFVQFSRNATFFIVVVILHLLRQLQNFLAMEPVTLIVSFLHGGERPVVVCNGLVDMTFLGEQDVLIFFKNVS